MRAFATLPARPHIPVMLHETVACATPAVIPEGAVFVDCTVGLGGHTLQLLHTLPTARVVGMDVDGEVLDAAAATLAPFGDRVTLVHASYADVESVVADVDGPVMGLVADFGANSVHFDTAGRGFSFMHDGPLDMRFDRRRGELQAADVVNTWSEGALAHAFSLYGEERHARCVARLIVDARRQAPLTTTAALATLISERTPRIERRGRSIHPATRVFQALRIVVNDELQHVEKLMDVAADVVHPGGCLAFLTFHSVEDKVVRLTLRRLARRPRHDGDPPPRVKLLHRKGLTASAGEVADNPRSRSAKLRGAVVL